MFCRNCGKELASGVQVCPNCGMEVMQKDHAVAGTLSYLPKAEVRNVLTADKNEMLLKLSAARPILEEAQVYFDRSEEYHAKEEDFKRRFKAQTSLKGSGKSAAAGAAIPFVLLIFAPLFLILIPFIAPVVIVIAVAVIIYLKRNRDKYTKLTMEEIGKGQAVLRQNLETLSFLEPEYWSVDAVDYLGRMLRNGRAESWRDALNYCDDYLYRQTAEKGIPNYRQYVLEVRKDVL